MDLLTKFENVEMKADTRISESDRIFCEAHQAAYDSARTSLPELGFIWDDMLHQQRELLAPAGTSTETYLVSYDGLKLSDNVIRQQIRSLHPRFICQIVSYFSKTYHFSIDPNDIIHNLVPQEPTDRWTDNYKELCQKYTQDMEKLSLCYTDILEQIFLQTGGRAFFEQALHELKNKCHQASWIISSGIPQFEQKKIPYSSQATPAASGTGTAGENGHWLTGQKISYGASPILKQILLILFPAVYQGLLTDMIPLAIRMSLTTAKKSSPCGCSRMAG